LDSPIVFYPKGGEESNIIAGTVAGGKSWHFVSGFGIVR
jgi:hypothetical protein